jgi:hypothetical protein
MQVYVIGRIYTACIEKPQILQSIKVDYPKREYEGCEGIAQRLREIICRHGSARRDQRPMGHIGRK